MERSDLEKILAAAVRAPSGENCQPWRFVSQGPVLFIYNIPERDRSPYNFHQLGSLVSHGAVIENIVIAASTLGYEVAVALFPLPAEPDCTAKLVFDRHSGGIKSDPLYENIFLRASNRTPYEAGHTIEERAKDRLLGCVEECSIPARVVLVEDENRKKVIGDAMSYGDRLLFENRAIHDFLFGHIYWTLDEVSKKRSGFYVKELALTPPQEFVFKLLKKEWIRRLLAGIGMPAVAAKENARLYAGSSALGAVITKGSAPADFIEGGRLLERFWLSATATGYDVQLITAISFFKQRISGNEAEDFSKDQIDGISASYAFLQKEFDVRDDTVTIMFRIGKGKPLPHRSLRLDPIVEYRT